MSAKMLFQSYHDHTSSQSIIHNHLTSKTWPNIHFSHAMSSKLPYPLALPSPSTLGTQTNPQTQEWPPAKVFCNCFSLWSQRRAHILPQTPKTPHHKRPHDAATRKHFEGRNFCQLWWWDEISHRWSTVSWFKVGSRFGVHKVWRWLEVRWWISDEGKKGRGEERFSWEVGKFEVCDRDRERWSDFAINFLTPSEDLSRCPRGCDFGFYSAALLTCSNRVA